MMYQIPEWPASPPPFRSSLATRHLILSPTPGPAITPGFRARCGRWACWCAGDWPRGMAGSEEREADGDVQGCGSHAYFVVTELNTDRFTENLRSDVRYITTWPTNGWTNQVINYMNVLYLAQITHRVPIIPRFRPVHMPGGDNIPHRDFGDVFDIPALSKRLGMPILEWKEVKDLKSKTLEDLGCWDIQNYRWAGVDGAWYLAPPVDLKLDISYTLSPEWMRRAGDGGSDPSTLMWGFAALATFPHWQNLSDIDPSPMHHASLPPDEHLFCTNSLYWGIANLEAGYEKSAAWHSVGEHMTWSKEVRNAGEKYTRQTLGIEEGEAIPPYIAVHIRRGDFAVLCDLTYHTPLEECLAPLHAYVRRVEEVRAELVEKTGMRVDRVMVTSNEQDEGWWREVAELGWVTLDHQRTVEEYGPWYPIFLDAFIQGEAIGFVGTSTSTVSILGLRRVESRGGVGVMVKWGMNGADDH
ncbi:hypothetical protein FB45DRAFT_946997 [Roridomyces roridus]|uniref:GDP-fucose protein O-fucosyltransferase 2 n=1 Tax=Roridomyces roridus TaxID=1738132 RepID=A0AAD7B1X5_9AGAR|nr:hypothetical protein FB45DRAFT_946997 [Roridomyces roridus]